MLRYGLHGQKTPKKGQLNVEVVLELSILLTLVDCRPVLPCIAIFIDRSPMIHRVFHVKKGIQLHKLMHSRFCPLYGEKRMTTLSCAVSQAISRT